jgi:predicted Zn finger-like uncharacterized protein
VHTECPHCGNEFDVLDRLAGRRVRCPRCGERFRAGAKAAKTSTAKEKSAEGARTVGHFLTRDVGIVVGGVVVVGIILGALVVRMWFDHQARAQQEAIQREAWANKDTGDQFRSRQEYAKALDKYMEAQKGLDRLDVADRKLQRELEAALQTDEMKYLAQGKVQFRGQWVTEQQKQATLAQEQGLVEFDGRWVKPEEKDRLEAEKGKAEAARQVTEEEASVRIEAAARGREVVDAFLRYAKDKAPAEAAERYMSPLTSEPLDVPPIVLDYAVDAEATYVAQDAERKQPSVSATYCGVKVYLTTSTGRGQERVVWNFQVRKIDNEWKITYSKQKEEGQPSAPPPPAAPAGQPAPQ